MKTGFPHILPGKVLLFPLLVPLLLPGLIIDVSGQTKTNQRTQEIIKNGPQAPGVARTAILTGDWTNPATWQGGYIPGSNDDVIINSGVNLKLDITASCATITFQPINTGSSALTVNETNSLTVSGSVFMPQPSAGYTCSINVGAGTLSIGTTLTMSASTIYSGTRTDNIIVTTGTCTISGNITCGTTGCIFNISDGGTINFGGTFSSSPTLTTASGSTVNYTSNSGQTILARTYNGNLGLSGTGTKSIASAAKVIVNGNVINNAPLSLVAGTESGYTYLTIGGDLTNNGDITMKSYARLYFSSSDAQTFTNNGTVTDPVAVLDVSNTSASGLTLAGNGFAAARVNLYTGTVNNSGKITLGNGGISSVTVQRGMPANTSPAGSFDSSPSFNAGTGGLTLIYDDGSVAYGTGYEVPSSTHACSRLYLLDAVDLSLGSDLTVSSELQFPGGSGTPSLRIGSHTLTVEGTIVYATAGNLYGGTSSNLVIKGPTLLNAVTNGLNGLTINSAAGATLGGAVTVNGTLYLTNGRLINGSNLTLAAGSTISRGAGYLAAAPSFGSTVNLAYSGSSSISTGYEIPAGSTVLNNLAVCPGGVVQSGNQASGTVSTIYTQGFNASPGDWTTEVVTNAGSYGSPELTYVDYSTSYDPVVTPSEGAACIEFNSDFCDAGDQIRLKKISSPMTTTGKTDITVVFDWYVYPMFAAYNDHVTVQWSADGSNWNTSYSFYRYNASAGWVTESCVLPAGAENLPALYIAFLFTSAHGNNCHLDNLKVDATTPGAATASSFTINGALDLTNGTYSIGAGNSLALGGSVTGSNAIIGSTTSNLSVTGSGGVLTLPSITNGLNDFTINRTGGAVLGGSNTVINGTCILTAGALSIGAHTLTLNGAVSTAGGTLSGGSSSDIVIGGSGAGTTLPSVTLNNLTLNRINGITPGGTVTVNGTLTLSSGTISAGTGAVAYGSGGILKYDGTGYSTTTGVEFPSVNGPKDVLVNNAAAAGLSLHASRTLTGNLTIATGKKFILPAGIRLTVSGTLSAPAGNAGLILRSDDTGTASLINGTAGVPATVERYIDHKDDNSAKWHFLSSPVSSQSICNGQFAPTPSGPPYTFGAAPWNWDFYYFNPNAPSSGYRLYWVNLRNEGGSYNANDIDKAGNDAGFGAYPPTFTAGRGYLAAYTGTWPGGTTHSFAGSLQAGNISRTLAYNAGGWTMNLVGNPYPSSLDWKSANWSRSALELNGSGYDYWIWNDADDVGNYGVFNSAGADGSGTNGAGRNIAPEQAFFVKAGGNGSLGMNDNVRVHSSQAWLKNTETESNTIRLKLTTDANTYSDEMIVEFNQAYTGGGSDKMWSFYTEAPEICAVKDGNYYSIDRYKEPSPELAVPVYAKTGMDASYTILAAGINDFSLSEKVYLDDLKTGISQELKNNPAYTFAGKPTDDPARFRLRFAGPYGTDNPGDQPEFTVYAIGNTVFVKGLTGDAVNGTLYICDMVGRTIARQQINGSSSEITVTAPGGVYLVNLVTDHKIYSRKIFVH